MVARAIIPVHSLDGSKVVAYIGRSTRDFIKPKFLFTKGFNKSKYLYNYHRAINKAKETSCIFITEGQGDVWKLHEAGVENAISIFGKSLSPKQKTILENSGVTKLVILTDNDQAGRESKIKIQREMSRMFKVIFPRMSTKDVGDMTVKQIEENILPQLEGMY
jgi:DNA primase